MKKNAELYEKESRSLKESYRYCQNIIQEHSKSFYYAFSRLPEAEAKAVYAVYAFCRIADDGIDDAEHAQHKKENIEQLEKELVQFGQTTLDHPMWKALDDVFKRYPMEKQPFFDQLTGQKMDIHFKQPETLEELEAYSEYVAGSVGVMLQPILTNDLSSEAKQASVDLGIAMQLTNVLRDVDEDIHQNNRIYLPKQLMETEGYTEEDLQQGIVDERFIRIWETLAERAEELYDRFSLFISSYSEESQLPVLASAYIYRGILDAVRKQDYDCFSKRAVVSAFQKERLYRKAKNDLNNNREKQKIDKKGIT